MSKSPGIIVNIMDIMTRGRFCATETSGDILPFLASAESGKLLGVRLGA